MSSLLRLILLLALTLGNASAAPHELAQRYRQWHEKCLAGDAEECARQIERFHTVLRARADDHLARAFLGSAYALHAKHSKWPPTKLKSLKRGKKEIEAAVAASPSDPRVRLVRAIAYRRVPARFGTRPTALADFRWLEKNLASLQPNEQQAALYHAVQLYAEQKLPAEAARAKARCLQIDPESPYAKALQD